MKSGFVFLTVLAVAAMLLAGCAIPGASSPSPGPSTGTIKVLVTDAPPSIGTITKIDVKVVEGGIAVHKAATEPDGVGKWIPIPIIGENPFDLLSLQKQNLDALLGQYEVEVGKYTQIRMTIDWVDIYCEGQSEPVRAKLPSRKLKFIHPFNVFEGGTTIILVDFIVDKSVTVTGNYDPDTGQGIVIFKPVVKLQVSNEVQTTELYADPGCTAEWSDTEFRSPPYSIHLQTTGEPGREARFIISLAEGTTLGDIELISWLEYLVGGYPPHVDIVLDVGLTEYPRLVFEYAYNTTARYELELPPTYGAIVSGPDDWYPTFNDDDDGTGLSQVDGIAVGWLSLGPPGPPDAANFATLAEWQSPTGVTYDYDSDSVTIDGDTPVLAIEIEVDNWLAQTQAFIDDISITIDGTTFTIGS